MIQAPQNSPKEVPPRSTLSPSPVKNTPSAASDNVTQTGKADYVKYSFPGPLPPHIAKKIEIDQATGCWIWTGPTLPNPKAPQFRYPVVTAGMGANSTLVHRYIYKLLHGMIPRGLELDHVICRNTMCVNDAHQELVTHQENCRRRKHSGPRKGGRP